MQREGNAGDGSESCLTRRERSPLSPFASRNEKSGDDEEGESEPPDCDREWISSRQLY